MLSSFSCDTSETLTQEAGGLPSSKEVSMHTQSKTKEVALRLAETIATALKSVKVFRMWHPQAPAELIACIFRD
jgi:hypothetical protein